MKKKSRILNGIGLLINLSIILFSIIGLYRYNTSIGFTANTFKYYTMITAFITLIASFLMIFANIINLFKGKNQTPRLFFSLRYISSVMSIITFVVVVAILCPSQKSYDALINFEKGFAYFHLICPLLSFINFVFFEIEPKARFKKTFEPFIATTLYAIGILIAMAVILVKNGNTAAREFLPYPFLRVLPQLCVENENFLTNIITSLVVLLGSYVFSILTWGLNRIMSSIFIGYEYKKIEKSKEKENNKDVETKEPLVFNESLEEDEIDIKHENDNAAKKVTRFIKRKVSLTNTSTNNDTVYHISYHNRKLRTWKVKGEGALRAVKVFNTQKEAIEYANSLVNKNGGSIRIHSMIGRIRKEW